MPLLRGLGLCYCWQRDVSAARRHKSCSKQRSVLLFSGQRRLNGTRIASGADNSCAIFIPPCLPRLGVSIKGSPAREDPGKGSGSWQGHGRIAVQPCHCSLAPCRWMGQRGLPSRAQTVGRKFPPAGTNPKPTEALINK